MRKTMLAATMLGFALTSGAALAGPTCTGQGEKLPEEKVQKMYEEKGIEIKKWKISSGGCYEIYGYENGERVEIYIDPWTGEVVQKYVE